MDPPEIARQLTHYERLPRAALKAASQQRAEMLPVFLSEIDRFLAADAERRVEPNPLFFIFHLLGEWHEPSAYRPLARLLRCGSDDIQHTIDEAVTTTSHRVMAAVFDGDPDPLYGIILDPDADEYGRARMFDALIMQVLAGRLPRDAVERFLHHCFDHMQPQDTCFVWDGWQHAVAALGLSAMTAQVKTAFDREFIEPFVTNFEYFEKDLAYAREHPGAPVRDHKDYTLFGDTIEELSSWYGFSETYEQNRTREKQLAGQEARQIVTDNGQPVVNLLGKVGRNQPCPCGSGKKFKKCCMP